MQIKVPASIDEATSSLGALGALLTAKQWERAAIVYAFTEPGNGQGSRTDLEPRTESSPKLSVTHFAALGIIGLRTKSAVSAYRQAWQSAIDDGQAQPVNPGDSVELPSIPWKDAFGEPTSDVQERIFRSVVRDPEQFREALRDAPDVVEAIAQRVVELPSTRVVTEAKLAEPVRERDYVSPPAPRPVDYSDDFRAAVNKLIPILHAIRDGRWEPDPADRALAAFLARAFQEIVKGEATADLFAEIDAFLAGQEATR